MEKHAEDARRKAMVIDIDILLAQHCTASKRPVHLLY